MRYVRILLLHFQKSLEIRSRAFVWFLLSLVNPFILILFWNWATAGKKAVGNTWTFSILLSYYLLLIVIESTLMSHCESDVGILDIQEGNLPSYLMKPFSYYWTHVFDELPYRVLQGIFGIASLFIFLFFLGKIFTISNSPIFLLLSLVIAILAYFLAFTFKMIVGIFAFWLIEIRGLFDAIEMILAIFSGYLMPIALFPGWLSHIAYALPFSYMIYFPIVSFEGQLTAIQTVIVIGMQLIWLVIFYYLYVFLWQSGLRKYAAFGK